MKLWNVERPERIANKNKRPIFTLNMDRAPPEHIQSMHQQPSCQRRRHGPNNEATSNASKQKSVYKSGHQLDTSLTKVFVGGLAWETTSESLQKHFSVYGDIVEAAVIVDRQNGRSKGYGFVTYEDEASAERAIQDPNPVIDDRKTNCVLAAEGARKRYGNGSGNEGWMKAMTAMKSGGNNAGGGGGAGAGAGPWGYYVVYGQPPFHVTEYGFQPVIYIPPGPLPPTSVYGAYIPASFTIPSDIPHDIEPEHAFDNFD